MALLILIGPPLLSQTPSDTLHGKSTDDVVVTGQFRPQSLKQSVYQVRVISRERIQQQAAVKLQDILSNELNIRFSQDAAIGSSNINMMGMSGQNVKVLMDGVPMAGRQGTSNEIDLNQVDVNTIERIEIVEGPLSVMYGADALAGVINIITKRAATQKWHADARIHEESVGSNYGLDQGIHNQSVNLGWKNKGWEMGAGGSHNQFYGWQGDTTGRVMSWKPKLQWLGNAQAKYGSRNWNLKYRLDYLNEEIDNNGNFIGNTAADQLYTSQRIMQQLQSVVTLSNKLSLQGMASYTSYNRTTTNTEIDKNTGIEYYSAVKGDETKFNNATGRATMFYKWTEAINLQAGADINYETGEGGRIAEGVNKITDVGLFIAPEFIVKKAWQIRPGIRAIYNSVYDAPPVVPSLNVKWAISPRSDLRVSYAQGFRAPSLRELYFYFFDANHQIEGNPDLKAEISNTINGSYSVYCKQSEAFTWQTVVTGFYNTVKNQIGYAQSPSNATLTTYMNIDTYKSTGGTILNDFSWKQLKAAVGFGYTGRYNQYEEDQKDLPQFNWSPEVNTRIGYAFAKIKMDINFFYKYTGSLPYYQQEEQNGETKFVLAKMDGYHWADLSVSKKLFKSTTVQLGLRNLFDVTNVSTTLSESGHGGSSSFRPVGYGRSWFAGIKYSFK